MSINDKNYDINNMFYNINEEKEDKKNINRNLSFGICSILNKDEEKDYNMEDYHLPNDYQSLQDTKNDKKDLIFSITPNLQEYDSDYSLLNYVQERHVLRQEKRIGHPYKSRAPPIYKKPRTAFTKEQITLLEDKFNNQKYLASSERCELAKKLQMNESQVKTWFQNRRTKWRRQEAEEKESKDKNIQKMTFTHLFFK